MPAPIRDIMRAAYGDAIAEVFLISAIIGLVALVAILFIKERPLRRTVDIRPEPVGGAAVRRRCRCRGGRRRPAADRCMHRAAECPERRRQGRLVCRRNRNRRPEPPEPASWTWTANSSRSSAGSARNPVSPTPPAGRPAWLPIRLPVRGSPVRRSPARTCGREGRRPPAGPDPGGRGPARGRRRRARAAADPAVAGGAAAPAGGRAARRATSRPPSSVRSPRNRPGSPRSSRPCAGSLPSSARCSARRPTTSPPTAGTGPK